MCWPSFLTRKERVTGVIVCFPAALFQVAFTETTEFGRSGQWIGRTKPGSSHKAFDRSDDRPRVSQRILRVDQRPLISENRAQLSFCGFSHYFKMLASRYTEYR